MPAPAPSVLLDPPRPAQLLDAGRRPVRVTERGGVPEPPALFGMGSDLTAVTSWAGPWPVDERWWSPDTARRAVRLQIVDVRGRAYLVSGALSPDSAPHWQVDAIYD
jgi:protein ImuB